MSSIKYTSDGKKVMVVDNLNSDQSVVCEIFIDESGSEVIGGHKFVEKNLFDAPVQSWKHRKIKEQDELIEKQKHEIARYRGELDSIAQEKKKQSMMLQANLNVLQQTADLTTDDVSFISDVITGNVKYAVRVGSDCTPKLFDEVVYRTDKSFEGLKLISFFGFRSTDYSEWGTPQANFRFNISAYADGSGGGGSEWVFFADDENLKKFIMNRLIDAYDKNSLRAKCIKEAAKYVEIPEYVIKGTKERLLREKDEKAKRSIESIKESHKEQQESISSEFDLILHNTKPQQEIK